MDEERFIELEKRMLYFEKYVDELNEVIVDQQTQISALKTELKNLAEKTKVAFEAGELRVIEEKPPHY
jgi:uncharacterized coiled-coil protein SlyX